MPGDGTRPITDRAKEALFSIIGDWIIDTRVLDLFGGTGSVGIEAVSRGAAFAQFVDANRKAVETIETNLRLCRFTEQTRVERGDSFAFLGRYAGTPFDLIFIAPPQYQGLWLKTLTLLDERMKLLAEYGTVVVQIDPHEEQPLALTHLVEYDRRRYGSVLLLFFARPEDLEDPASEEDLVEEGT